MRSKKILVWVLFATFCFCGGYLLGNTKFKKEDNVTMAAPVEEINPVTSILTGPQPKRSPTPVSTPEKNKYLLMLSGETIHLYELLDDGGTSLLQETPVDTGHLRKEDYESLCRGMVLQNLEEAKSLCEDFAG